MTTLRTWVADRTHGPPRQARDTKIAAQMIQITTSGHCWVRIESSSRFQTCPYEKNSARRAVAMRPARAQSRRKPKHTSRSSRPPTTQTIRGTHNGSRVTWSAVFCANRNRAGKAATSRLCHGQYHQRLAPVAGARVNIGETLPATRPSHTACTHWDTSIRGPEASFCRRCWPPSWRSRSCSGARSADSGIGCVVTPKSRNPRRPRLLRRTAPPPPTTDPPRAGTRLTRG